MLLNIVNQSSELIISLLDVDVYALLHSLMVYILYVQIQHTAFYRITYSVFYHLILEHDHFPSSLNVFQKHFFKKFYKFVEAGFLWIIAGHRDCFKMFTILNNHVIQFFVNLCIFDCFLEIDSLNWYYWARKQEQFQNTRQQIILVIL